MKMIARIHTDFVEKFGIPRQSGLVPELMGRIVFEPEFREADALRGIENYSYLWLLWKFSDVPEGKWSPLVRPPRLGGNMKVGVFATRSPFRPNPIGLSSVKIEQIELHTDEGPVITVSGVDLMDGTPIYDIKPYLPHVDCHPEAMGGFSGQFKDYSLRVDCPLEYLNLFPEEKRNALLGVLAQDPRPAYQHDEDRVYGVSFAGHNVQFKVANKVLTVCGVEEL
ncbi:MAG: tRNA (N6-threonylcarbamoyladenosine(37)-N6)-methyltransferase TrmO [Coprococcus sp.]